MAISGLNISLIAGTFYLLMIALRFPRKAAALLALALTLWYAAAAGGGVPVRRAGWMAGLAFLACMLDRPSASLNLFFLAYLILLAGEPFLLASVSFQLSFLSVLALILFWSRFRGTWIPDDALASSLAATAGTFPACVWHFNVFSATGLAANMGAIPLFHLALLGAFGALAFGNVPFLGWFFIRISVLILKASLGWVRLWAGLDWGYFYLPRPGWPEMGFYYAALGLWIGLKTVRRPWAQMFSRAAAGFWLVSLLIFFRPQPAPGFQLTIFAAGANQMAHVQFGPRDHWLLNAGRLFPNSQAERLLMPYLRSRGIKQLTGIVLSSHYRKHTGGLEILNRNFHWKQFWYPPFETLPFYRYWRGRHQMQAGDSYRAGPDLEMRILSAGPRESVILWKADGKSWLVLPALSPAALDHIRANRAELNDLQVLALEDSAAGNDLWEKLLNEIDPAAVVRAGQDARLEQMLAARDIRFIDLKTEGAVTMTPAGLTSFRHGKIETY